MKVLLEKRPSSQRTVMLRLLRLVYPDVKGLAGGDWWLCHKLWTENQAGNKHEQKCKVQCWGKVAFSSNVPRELCWLKSKLASGFWSEWKRNQVLCLQHEIVLQCDTSATYGTAVLHLNLDSHQFAAFWVAVYTFVLRLNSLLTWDVHPLSAYTPSAAVRLPQQPAFTVFSRTQENSSSF